jgi:hypothetical protein
VTNKSVLREGLELRDSLFHLKNLSEQEQDLAVRNFPPSVKEFWRSVREIRLTDEQAGDLISAAEDFALADTLRRNAAGLRSGDELPDHIAFKDAIGNRKIPYFNERNPAVPAFREEGMEIKFLETDRLFWSEKRIKRKFDKLLRDLADIEGSLTLRSVAPIEVLVAARALRRQKSSQSDLHTDIRSGSLRRVVETVKGATDKPHWKLIADAINLASGGAINLDASSVRREHDRAQKRANLAANVD